ncbi:DeoR-like helix-turn-helix domain protein (fragment) [Carnobacterium maltaromaticum]
MTPLGESMKKDVRLTKELYFINNRVKFNLRDLMDEFSISKSTALRDISSLEEIGVPLYAEYGKNGGYQVINQHFLPPVYFSDDEVFSIFLLCKC